jgi:hypothetical protein
MKTLAQTRFNALTAEAKTLTARLVAVVNERTAVDAHWGDVGDMSHVVDELRSLIIDLTTHHAD